MLWELFRSKSEVNGSDVESEMLRSDTPVVMWTSDRRLGSAVRHSSVIAARVRGENQADGDDVG